MINKAKFKNRDRIRKHIRKNISGTTVCPRLSVYRSLKHIYAQLIDDTKGNTIVSVSTRSKDLQDSIKEMKSKTELAKLVGIHLAKKAIENNIQTVVFDRGGFKYHGNVKAIADGAREGGLKF